MNKANQVEWNAVTYIAITYNFLWFFYVVAIHRTGLSKINSAFWISVPDQTF